MLNNVKHYPNGNPANNLMKKTPSSYKPPLVKDPVKLMQEESLMRTNKHLHQYNN